MDKLKNIDFFNLESSIWVANKIIHVPAYDFQFEPLFSVSRPRIQEEVAIISRTGAIHDYDLFYQICLDYGFRLINSPIQHQLASELEHWYPSIHELTPRSKVYEQFPTFSEFSKDFEFPVFIKGNRQTSKHNPELSIAKTEADFHKIKDAYQKDHILHWQKVVFREFIPLHPLEYKAKNKVQISFEFRTFWWKKELVGAGHYWSQFLDYHWTDEQRKTAIGIAKKAAQLLDIPFLAIDLALTARGKWIIIECNDAQESGYCGINPMMLWKNIVALEKIRNEE